MCLYTNRWKPLIAKEDIICYKILVKTKNPFVYRTPVIRTKVIKIPFFKRTFKAKGNRRITFVALSNYIDTGLYEVSEGFIHTYKEIKSAKHQINYNLYEDECVIFKCIIPKGTCYYESDNEYASEKIEILDEVKVNFFEDLIVYVD